MLDDGGAFDSPRIEDALFRAKRKKGKLVVIDPPTPPLEAPVADTHAHLDLIDAPLALARSAAHNVTFICCMTDVDEGAQKAYDALDSWQVDAQQMLDRVAPGAAALPDVRLAAGCHPHNAKDWTDSLESNLRRLLADPRTCAIGEVGLDYHYDYSTPEQQRTAFCAQIRFAHETGLPLILHIREAHDEALALLEDEGFPAAGTLLHCCSLAPDQIKPWIAHGCYIAYGGALTFKKADEARSAAALVPSNHLLTETDAPYMAPEPLRGTSCAPDYTVFTAARLAAVRGCAPGPDRKQLLEQMMGNARALLDRGPTSWQIDRS